MEMISMLDLYEIMFNHLKPMIQSVINQPGARWSSGGDETWFYWELYDSPSYLIGAISFETLICDSDPIDKLCICVYEDSITVDMQSFSMTHADYDKFPAEFIDKLRVFPDWIQERFKTIIVVLKEDD